MGECSRIKTLSLFSSAVGLDNGFRQEIFDAVARVETHQARGQTLAADSGRGEPRSTLAWRSKCSHLVYKVSSDRPGKFTGPFHWKNRRFTIAGLKRPQPSRHDDIVGESPAISALSTHLLKLLTSLCAAAILFRRGRRGGPKYAYMRNELSYTRLTSDWFLDFSGKLPWVTGLHSVNMQFFVRDGAARRPSACEV
jgi:hypothetical protein